MVQGVLDRIKLLFNHKPTAGQGLASAWDAKSKRTLAKMEKQYARLEAELKRVQNIADETTVLLADATKLQREHETAIAALQAENAVMEKSTIPALVQSNKLILETLDADTAVAVKRRLAMQGVAEREEMT